MTGWQEVTSWVAPQLDEERLKQLETKVCPSCGREYEGFFVRCQTDQMTLTDVPPPRGPIDLPGGKSYECVRKIGVGSLFDVYEGKDTASEDKVIIKVLRRDFECEQRQLKSFEQDQIIASSLKHDSISSALAFGALPEQYSLRPFVVVRRLDGISLARALGEWGACDEKTAVTLMNQICEGFEHAQTVGAVHCDFKPSNVYLSASGKSPKATVVDFAVNNKLFPGKETTRYGAGSGTQSLSSATYTAPEVAKGTAPNTVSDIYAVGCVFYEMLAGKPPFQGNSTFDLAYRHEKDDPEPLPENVASKEIREAVMHCLAKDPAQRPKDFSELKAALSSKVSGSR